MLEKHKYMLWIPERGIPTQIHDDINEIKKEAERLVRKERKIVYLFKAISKFEIMEFPIQEIMLD